MARSGDRRGGVVSGEAVSAEAVSGAASDRVVMPSDGSRNDGGVSDLRDRDDRVDDVLATVLFRNAYKRERHLFLTKIVAALAVLSSVSTVGLVMLALRPVETRYFLVDPEGRIRSIVPLDRPVESVEVVGNWVANAIRASFTFNYVNYRETFAEIRNFFTPNGFESFQNALIESRILPSVIQNNFILTATVTGAPVLEVQGIMEVGGISRYAWRYQVPILLTYQAPSGQQTQALLVSATVVRVPVEQNPSGLGIVQILARSGGGR